MGRLAKQPDRKKWIEWICINLNIHVAATASHDLFCSDHFNSGNIMKIRLKLGSVPELFVEPNINIVRDCIGGLVIMYLFYICNCLNLKPSVSNVAKAEYRSVLDQPNGNAVVIDLFGLFLKYVRPMVLGAKHRAQDRFVWRCNKCQSMRSVRVCSWFAESKMPLRKIILIIYMSVYKFFQDHIMRDVDISKKTVVDWFSFCREVCVKIMIRQHEAA
ncbi:Transcriptional repressor NrdR [Frankliniella fusca]|uniref:Transcriptional repressor NrdR n=1 Tax=Frankliniella fusca TaxID=407009 RepID=A0AAE1L5J8_9NEOP|nr:Transcriptional repressor NrdR [Frankliniella fusca]